MLDVGTMIAGPLLATLLADFGADVVKVEAPGVGDPIRGWSPHVGGSSLWWKVIARNKRLVTMNLRHPKAAPLVQKLVERSDVLVENFRPGTLARWGYGDEVLRTWNPGLVIAHVSGYGQTGPYRDRPGYGTVAEAMSGIPAFTGFPDNPPTLSAFPLADSLAAVFGAMGVGFALNHRAATGRGQSIDVSLYEPLFRLVEAQVVGYDQLGIVKERRGNRMEEDSPRNTYATRDGGWIALSASSDRTFERLARAIGQPELSADPRFTTNSQRILHADLLDEVIAGWFRERTTAEALDELNANDVVAGPIFDIRDIFQDPHYRSRGDIVDVPDDELGTVRMQTAIPFFSETPGVVRFAGRRLGADNPEVYGELGLSPDAIRTLCDEGVL